MQRTRRAWPERRTLRSAGDWGRVKVLARYPAYRGLEQEFGTVDVFVDLHDQGPCCTGEGTGEDSTLSISGRSIADPSQSGSWPEFDDDASRRVDVAVFDALQRGDSPYGAVTLAPQDTDLPGTDLSSFALRGRADPRRSARR
jgi:hypothetical protein